MPLLSDLADEFEPMPEHVVASTTAPFRFITDSGQHTACWTLADVVQEARHASGEQFVKLEVFKHHYRVYAQDGRSIGTVRFHGGIDPVALSRGWEPK